MEALALFAVMTLGRMLGVIIILCIVGFAVWALTRYIPMPAIMKNVIMVLAVIVLVVYLLNALGVNVQF